jgi:hypothetical protein
MTPKETRTLAVYCTLAFAGLTRLHTGNLWVRLGVSLAVFFLVPAAALAWKHRQPMVRAGVGTPS